MLLPASTGTSALISLHCIITGFPSFAFTFHVNWLLNYNNLTNTLTLTSSPKFQNLVNSSQVHSLLIRKNSFTDNKTNIKNGSKNSKTAKTSRCNILIIFIQYKPMHLPHSSVDFLHLHQLPPFIAIFRLSLGPIQIYWNILYVSVCLFFVSLFLIHSHSFEWICTKFGKWHP